ncbi:MAG TPA: histidine phosphatase family protein [Mycobacteriales bacterium]|nr:histidine phosphatase family protein [Mycobacteriales bacterium]
MTIYLVRHAAPVIPSTDGPDDMHRPLTAEGFVQAAELAATLVDLRPTRFVSSPYPRAIQTIAPAALRCGLPVLTDSRLREWDSGMAPSPDYARRHAENWSRPEWARPGGESLAQLTARAVAALEDYREGVTIVGSHGTFISRALAGFGLPVSWEFARKMPMPAVYAIGAEISGPNLPLR